MFSNLDAGSGHHKTIVLEEQGLLGREWLAPIKWYAIRVLACAAGSLGVIIALHHGTKLDLFIPLMIVFGGLMLPFFGFVGLQPCKRILLESERLVVEIRWDFLRMGDAWQLDEVMKRITSILASGILMRIPLSAIESVEAGDGEVLVLARKRSYHIRTSAPDKMKQRIQRAVAEVLTGNA